MHFSTETGRYPSDLIRTIERAQTDADRCCSTVEPSDTLHNAMGQVGLILDMCADDSIICAHHEDAGTFQLSDGTWQGDGLFLASQPAQVALRSDLVGTTNGVLGIMPFFFFLDGIPNQQDQFKLFSYFPNLRVFTVEDAKIKS